MRMIQKIIWLLLTAGLLVLSIQTASAIALGLAACLILLPLVLLPMNLRAAKKLKLTEKLPVNLRKGERGTAELTVQNPTVFPICRLSCRVRPGKSAERGNSGGRDQLRRVAEGRKDHENHAPKPVLWQNSRDGGICEAL